MINRPTQYLLNIGHAIDHMFLLIFATAVTSIATEFGIGRWEDLMPYSVPVFLFFGLGSIPAGRLGDHWGRRPMMIVFFFGMGAAAFLVSAATSPTMMAVALAVLGTFASIYHPVGIPMLVQGALRPGWAIGVNGLVGNLGVAAAAVATGFLVKYFGWRMAFVVPGIVSMVCGVLFAMYASKEVAAPAKKRAASAAPPLGAIARLLLIMTLAATTSSLLFNFSTTSNYEMLADRFQAITTDPAQIGMMLGMVYAVASLTQLVVGNLIDKHSLRTIYMSVIGLQVIVLMLAATMHGWMFYALQLLIMVTIFGAVPFTDAMMVRFVDDSMRSRVSGVRLAVSLAASSLAVWLVGPLVKQAGFSFLLWVMAGISVVTLLIVSRLPGPGHQLGGGIGSRA